MISKRSFLKGSTGFAVALGTGAVSVASRAVASTEVFEITKSEDEWRAILSPEQFRVLREEGTERAFSSPLDTEKRAGNFHCAGCDLALYSSEAKYDSGTGWPSFWEPLEDAIRTREDRSLFLQKRTEVHCRRCGGHLGHVFNDGPEPTGLRYCMNGLAMVFRPA